MNPTLFMSPIEGLRPNAFRWSQHNCIYCQKRTSTKTGDHIPPRAIFPKKFQHELLTVPACDVCNGRLGDKDEAFAVMLSSEYRPNSKFDTEEQSNRNVKSIVKHLKGKKYDWFKKTVRKVNFFDATKGLYLPTLAYMLPEEDMLRVINRIIRGLYFLCVGKALPENIQVRSIAAQNCPEGFPINIFMALNAILAQLPITSVGDDVFRFSGVRLNENEISSVWYLELYRHRKFIGFVSTNDWKSEINLDELLK